MSRWVYCPGHAGVNGNDRADRLAGKATVTTGWISEDRKCRVAWELLAGTKPGTSHHRSPGGERCGKRKRSTIFLKTMREGHRQSNIGTVSNAILGNLLRDGVERIWAFPSAQIPFWTEQIYFRYVFTCLLVVLLVTWSFFVSLLFLFLFIQILCLCLSYMCSCSTQSSL